MHLSRIWREMKDRHLIMDTELMNYRLKVGRDIRRPLVPFHDQNIPSTVVLSSFEIMLGPYQVILSTNKDRNLKTPSRLISSP